MYSVAVLRHFVTELLQARFKAVELLEQNIGNRVVAMQGGKIIDLDINEALDMPRVFDEELYKIAMTISI